MNECPKRSARPLLAWHPRAVALLALILLASACMNSTREHYDALAPRVPASNVQAKARGTRLPNHTKIYGSDAPLALVPRSSPQDLPINAGLNSTTPARNSPRGMTAGRRSSCHALLTHFAPFFQKLQQTLPQKNLGKTSAAFHVAAARPSDCLDPNRNTIIMRAVVDAVNNHQGRVGLILPLSGPRASAARHVVEGMRAAIEEKGLKFDQVFIVKDSAGDAATAEQRLAELVFHDQAAFIIGGIERSEAQMLARWSQSLMLPVLLLSGERALVTPSRYAFRVFPDEMRLATRLVETALQRNLKRIAILRPKGGKADRIAEYFRQTLIQKGGSIAQDLSFVPGNYDSMSAASRMLFKIDPSTRRDEYMQSYKKAKTRAKEQGVAFNPRMVLLKPILDFDAVFLPADFRTARHFAKLFKFQQVDKLTMIGNHEWRSPALIEPYDDFLEGAFFADFIGSYAQLPTTLGALGQERDYFTKPEDVAAVDFRMIGYRVGRTAQEALSSSPKTRRFYAKVLSSLQSDSRHYFGKGKVFDQQRQANWPAYVFTVTQHSLTLDSDTETLSGKALVPSTYKPSAREQAGAGRFTY